MGERSAASKASVGVGVGAILSLVGGLCLLRGIGYSDSSAPENWLMTTVALTGCVACPAGGITFILSLMFYAVNRKAKEP